MKKLVIVAFCTLSGYAGVAQYDPKALEILEAMSKKYKAIPSFEADFSYTLSNESEKINEQFQGKMTVKGEKFRLVLPEQQVINDGITQWTYLPEAKEVTIDNVDNDSEDINPSKFYDMYRKGYKYLHFGDITEGGVACDVVDLVPEKRDAQYFKIKMNISKKDKSVQSFTMFDKTGNRYKYTITHFSPNAKIDDTYFSFDPKKYPNVDVQDIRH
jgi:outer membrane lipoprotein carrier protein